MSEQAPFIAGWSIDHEPETEQLADQTRKFITALRRANASQDALVNATELLRQATDLLTPFHTEGLPMQGRLGDSGPTGISKKPREFFPWSPIIGPLNPISADMHLEFNEGEERTRGRAFFATQFTGPPGMVHGGIIALAFDELLGATNVCLGLGGFTGTLSVRYERPTPIEAEIALDAWVESVEGRKVRTVGTMSFGGEVTARAEGIFIMTAGWKRPDS